MGCALQARSDYGYYVALDKGLPTFSETFKSTPTPISGLPDRLPPSCGSP